MKAKSSASVIKVIGCDKLTLLRGSGYWYFVYDDVDSNIWETESVYVCYLSQLTVEQWATIGREFVARVQQAK